MALSKPLKDLPALAAAPSDNSRLQRLIPLLLIGLVVAVMWPLLLGDFTIWDDRRAIVTIAWLNPPSLQKMAEFWNPKHAFMDIWIPLTYTLWSAVAAVSYVDTPDPETGAHLNPWVFHGANLAVHAISALVVYTILRRVTRKNWPAAAGAALYAIHPVQVEPVGWIAGMKDLLAGCLGLIATWQYLLFATGSGDSTVAQIDSSPNRAAGALLDRAQTATVLGYGTGASSASKSRMAHYAIATAAFVLAMLSKPSAIVIPMVVASLDLFLLRRPIRLVAKALVPWLLLTIPIIIEGRLVQPGVHTPAVALWLRPLIAADTLAFYLYKLVFPLRLGLVYERTPQAALAHGWPYYTWIVPAAVVVLLFLCRKRYAWLIAAVGVYWLAVFPVVGFVPFDFQFYSTVADHYLYLAMLGPALALAMALRNVRGRSAIVVVTIVLLAFAARAFLQTWTWRDSISLFSNAVTVNPHACGIYADLGEAYRDKHDYPSALATFEKGVRLNPDCVELRIGYASTLAAVGQPQEARRQYELAARTATGSYATMIQEGLAQLEKDRTGGK